MVGAEREAWACARAQQGPDPSTQLRILWPVSSILVFGKGGTWGSPGRNSLPGCPRSACHADDSSGGGGGRLGFPDSVPAAPAQCPVGRGPVFQPCGWTVGTPLLACEGGCSPCSGTRGERIRGEGKRGDSWEERWQEELPGGRPGKGSVSICQHPSVSRPSPGSWEAARAGAGEWEAR